MASCSHGSTAPDEVILSLPICQGGKARHKCAICAYVQGLEVAGGKVFAGPSDQCGKRHASAPLAMAEALPTSQAKPYRHRCSYLAFQMGKAAGEDVEQRREASEAEEREQSRILAQRDITVTQKEQLVLARRGQGVFRDNVTRLMSACPVTGTTDPRFLIASHIKPWRTSSNEERLDGYNGLLLSPHVDHLFDKGWFTFELSGALVQSPQLPSGVWKAWGLGRRVVTTTFDPHYGPYLEYHQNRVFKA